VIQFNVEYTKRVTYEAVVELDDSDIEQLLKDEVYAHDASYDNGQLHISVSADIDDMIRDKVEAGDMTDETAINEDEDVDDIDVQGIV